MTGILALFSTFLTAEILKKGSAAKLSSVIWSMHFVAGSRAVKRNMVFSRLPREDEDVAEVGRVCHCNSNNSVVW